MTGKKSITRFAEFFPVFMLSMKVNSIVILNFHWDLLYIVDMPECEKGSFGKSACPKPQRQPFFPVISTSSLSTHLFLQQGFSNYICLPSPLPCANVRPNEVIQFLFVFWARCQLIGNTGFDHTPARVDGAQVRERYYPTPPHPAPPLRDVTHLQRSMTYVRTCK